MNRRVQLGMVGVVAGITILLILVELPFRAIWPSVAALLLVFITRNVLGSLFLGAFAGTLLLAEGNLLAVPLQLVERHLLPNFASSWKSGAVLFTLLLGGMVHLLERGGILQAFLQRLLHGQSGRRIEGGAAAFGLICFFDGLANSLMVGRIFQPLAGSAGLNRLRLAYIVDTTSAAVACLAFISTWIAYQLAMIREGLLLAGREGEADPYSVFFASIPHNYYAWFALLLMVLAIARQWNIGPMGRLVPRNAPDWTPAAREGGEAPSAGGLWRAWVPVASLLLVVFGGIYLDGTARLGQPAWPLSVQNLALAFSEANVPAILIIASTVASLLAWLFFPGVSLARGETRESIFLEGLFQLFKPVLILIMAWMLSSTLRDLEAAAYLGELLGGRIPPALFPLAVFLTAGLVAFTTGTSWGTMGLLMPLAIPLAFGLSPDHPGTAWALLPMVAGAVFSGAVFGDHCSPISDTTIVSSMACGVDTLDHVRTQLPYALLAALGAALFGFLPAAALGGSGWWAPAGSAGFLVFLLAAHAFSQRNAGKS